jgi:peptide/nickel transport system substrate-binding protein
VGWNNERPVFRDARVRRALAMLFEREKINLALYADLNDLANCVFYHLGPNCDPATRQPAYDPMAAAALLEEAGWIDSDGDGVLDKDGLKFHFTITIPSGNPVNEQLLLVYQQQLYRLGIEMDIQKVEWSIYSSKLRNHEFDACMLSWISSSPESDPYQVWHSSQTAGGSNYVNFQNAEVDQLVETIRGTFDVEERRALFRKLNEKIIDEQPLMPMFHSPRRTLIHRRLKGVYISPMQFFQVRDMWVDPSWGEAS